MDSFSLRLLKKGISMIVIGVIIVFIGFIGIIWASSFNPGWEDKIRYFVDGSSSSGYVLQRFFNSYGILIILIGLGIIIYGVYRAKNTNTKMNHSFDDKSGISFQNGGNQAIQQRADGNNQTIWILNPSTGERMWQCGCGQKNSYKETTCNFCGRNR